MLQCNACCDFGGTTPAASSLVTAQSCLCMLWISSLNVCVSAEGSVPSGRKPELLLLSQFLISVHLSSFLAEMWRLHTHSCACGDSS